MDIMVNIEFPGWLQAELKKRGWRQADLSRGSGVSEAQIARILSGSRSPGPEALLAIARALSLPPVAVFRQAGLLPDVSTDPREENLLHLFRQMDEIGKDELIAYAEWKFISEQRKNQIGELRHRLDNIPDDKTDEAFTVVNDWLLEIGGKRVR